MKSEANSFSSHQLGAMHVALQLSALNAAEWLRVPEMTQLAGRLDDQFMTSEVSPDFKTVATLLPQFV